MKEIDKRMSNTDKTSRSGRSERRDHGLHQENASKTLYSKQTESKVSCVKPDSSILVSNSNAGAEPSEVYVNMVIHYMDDVNRFEEAPQDSKANKMIVIENNDKILDDLKPEESDSVSSKLIPEDENAERASGVPKSNAKKNSSERCPHGSRLKSIRETNKARSKASDNTPKKMTKFNRGLSRVTTKNSSESNFKKFPAKLSAESSEGADEKLNEEVKEIDVLDEASNGGLSLESDNETADAENNGGHENEVPWDQNIEEMEKRIEKLEEELREVAALEISLYSVVPEHGSSAHKVHTPARRLSRLYIHACKHWTQDKRATIAKNTISGLVLIAKSCGNDVPRLTFWMSNTIVLREIISQAFGSSHHSSPVTRFADSNGCGKRSERNSIRLKWKGNSSIKHMNNLGFMQFVNDWQETGTFTAALEKVESRIFSRIVESVWWQALTPNMQSPVEDLSTNKSTGRLLGPALGDQQQGSFSINLWKTAFQDAFQRLCPVRAGGHECGCLSVLARMVMEQCIARLDVAMFNAILRESAHEIPTDPVSDPIVDSKVLPIPAGDLSFGSGAQLKNSVGNWSRWLTDNFGVDAGDYLKDQDNHGDNDRQDGDSFHLLNALSDLLMLPKDMLMDRSIRKEVGTNFCTFISKHYMCSA